jgi:hypothetical protein
LLGELEEETVAEVTRTVVNEHIDYMNGETKNLLDDIHVTFNEEIEKPLGAISSVATKALKDKGSKPTSLL